MKQMKKKKRRLTLGTEGSKHTRTLKKMEIRIVQQTKQTKWKNKERNDSSRADLKRNEKPCKGKK